MISQGLDVSQVNEYAHAILVRDGAFTSGVDVFTDPRDLYYGVTDAIASRILVEPHFKSKVAPLAGPPLDALSRLMVVSSIDENGGTMDSTAIDFKLQWSRDDGSNWVQYPDSATGFPVSLDSTDGRSLVHIMENPFPADFMQADGIGLTDQLFLRAELEPTATSTGDVLVMLAVFMLPGPTQNYQTKPRGAIFSEAGIAY